MDEPKIVAGTFTGAEVKGLARALNTFIDQGEVSLRELITVTEMVEDMGRSMRRLIAQIAISYDDQN